MKIKESDKQTLYKQTIYGQTKEDNFFIKNYSEYIKNLKNRKWKKEHFTLHENLSRIVTVNYIRKENDGIVIDILCPSGRILSIDNTYPFEIKLASSSGEELDPDTHIKIIKNKILRECIELYDIQYKEIDMLNYSESPHLFKGYDELFRFKDGIELKGEDHLKIFVVNPNIDIDLIKFNLDIDIWTMTDYDNDYEYEKEKRSIDNYTEYISYLYDRRYNREQITLDENSEIVERRSLAKSSTGTVLDIRCPSRYKIIILGRDQLTYLDKKIDHTHSLAVRIANSEDLEISPDTRIGILKTRPSGSISTITYVLYKHITITEYLKIPPNETKREEKWYKFDQGIEINGDEHLIIEIINSDINIDASHTRLYLDIDLWEGE